MDYFFTCRVYTCHKIKVFVLVLATFFNASKSHYLWIKLDKKLKIPTSVLIYKFFKFCIVLATFLNAKTLIFNLKDTKRSQTPRTYNGQKCSMDILWTKNVKMSQF